MEAKSWLRLLLLFFCCLCYGGLSAQKLQVESFVAATTDITASSDKYARVDGNGDFCALVKVRLAASGAVFSGDICGDVDNHQGEYWVYMCQGARKLQVRHEDYIALDVDFRDYGINGVEGKKTYILTLLKPNGDKPADDGVQYLLLSVNPTNAMVQVDGELVSVNDGKAKVLLKQGRHQYEVKAIGYASKSGEVIIGKEKKQITVELVSLMSQVTVVCPTTGASIYINDELKGSAPWKGSLAKGTYQVEARCNGYRSSKQSVSIDNNEQRTVTLPALVATTGILNVDFEPMDAEVWLDDKKIGTSPNIFSDIMVGTHTVELKATGYDTEKKQVTINEGETAIVSGSLKKKASDPVVSSQTSTQTTPSSIINA